MSKTENMAFDQKHLYHTYFDIIFFHCFSVLYRYILGAFFKFTDRFNLCFSPLFYRVTIPQDVIDMHNVLFSFCSFNYHYHRTERWTIDIALLDAKNTSTVVSFCMKIHIYLLTKQFLSQTLRVTSSIVNAAAESDEASYWSF